MDRQYVYLVKSVEKVTDGDTYWLHLDVGFRQSQLTHVRLQGFDCPEANRGSEFEKSEAIRAKQVAAIYFGTAATVWCRTYKDPDNFGRWLGYIWDDNGVSLADDLVAQDLATVWPTRWREVYDK